MNNVTMHVIANQNKVPILASKNSINKIGELLRGEWMGVRKEEGDFYEVITIHGLGWVEKQYCQSFITSELSVSQGSNGITYLAA